MADFCGHILTEAGSRILTESGNALVTECFTVDQPFGLARLFHWQNEQELLKRKRKRRQEEELLALISLEL